MRFPLTKMIVEMLQTQNVQSHSNPTQTHIAYTWMHTKQRRWIDIFQINLHRKLCFIWLFFWHIGSTIWIHDKHAYSFKKNNEMKNTIKMNTWLTFNGAVLLQEGGRAREGVRRCGTSWGDSGGARRHDGVTRRRVLTPISIDLHIQEQLILFNTSGERESKKKLKTGVSW